MLNPFAKKAKKHRPPKGRTDLGVTADETGAYTTVTAAGKPCVVYRLRNINDGMLRDFVDDGDGREGVALNGRANLINVISKEVQSFEGDDEVSFPAFFADKRIGNGLDRIGRYRVPVATKEIKAECARRVERRRKMRESRAESYEREKQARIMEQLALEERVRKQMGTSNGQ